MNETSTLLQLKNPPPPPPSNHGCSLTPSLLIAVQLRVQLENLDEVCD